MTQLEQSISVLKPPLSPSKLSSPSNFLRKDSNLAGFTAWDVDGRVNNVNAQFMELKEMLSTTLEVQKGQDDVMEQTKTRGKSLVTPTTLWLQIV